MAKTNFSDLFKKINIDENIINEDLKEAHKK